MEPLHDLHDHITALLMLCKTVEADVMCMQQLRKSQNILSIRMTALKKIHELLPKLSSDSMLASVVRDLSAQMLDTFMIRFHSSGHAFLNYSDVESLAASLLCISSKMMGLDSISSENFSIFPDQSAYIASEFTVLRLIRFHINPQVTPSNFLISFVQLIKVDQPDMTDNVLFISDLSIQNAMKGTISLYHAPPVIAASAVLLSCSQCGVDCSKWLELVCAMLEECSLCIEDKVSSASPYSRVQHEILACVEDLQLDAPATHYSPLNVLD